MNEGMPCEMAVVVVHDNNQCTCVDSLVVASLVCLKINE